MKVILAISVALSILQIASAKPDYGTAASIAIDSQINSVSLSIVSKLQALVQTTASIKTKPPRAFEPSMLVAQYLIEITTNAPLMATNAFSKLANSATNKSAGAQCLFRELNVTMDGLLDYTETVLAFYIGTYIDSLTSDPLRAAVVDIQSNILKITTSLDKIYKAINAAAPGTIFTTSSLTAAVPTGTFDTILNALNAIVINMASFSATITYAVQLIVAADTQIVALNTAMEAIQKQEAAADPVNTKSIQTSKNTLSSNLRTTINTINSSTIAINSKISKLIGIDPVLIANAKTHYSGVFQKTTEEINDIANALDEIVNGIYGRYQMRQSGEILLFLEYYVKFYAHVIINNFGKSLTCAPPLTPKIIVQASQAQANSLKCVSTNTVSFSKTVTTVGILITSLASNALVPSVAGTACANKGTTTNDLKTELSNCLNNELLTGETFNTTISNLADIALAFLEADVAFNNYRMDLCIDQAVDQFTKYSNDLYKQYENCV